MSSKPKVYIYELPYDVNKEMCRLLDHDDKWKVLAANMQYNTFDVEEMEKVAQRTSSSPTNQLFIRWGHLNHNVNELFVLLCRMKYVPALRLIKPFVLPKLVRYLNKLDSQRGGAEENQNNQKVPNNETSNSDSRIPLPVMLIQQGVPIAPSIHDVHSTSASNETISSGTGSSGVVNNINDEIIKNASVIPMMSYEELKIATNNWNEANLLGRGGFGQVFKGEWKFLPIAVKRLQTTTPGNNDGNRELVAELCLNHYRHDNILPLYGYSLGGPEVCLVYQLMAGGSLESRLKCRTHHPPLTWAQRYIIAHGVARGLQFLHTMTGTPLIHGDIKPANILLDQCTIPKIGDFGLARKGAQQQRTHLVSQVHGTRPYLPEDYIRYHCLSPAVDVYSYGVVLLELATALPVQQRERPERMLAQYMHALAATRIPLETLEDCLLRNGPQSDPRLCFEFITIGLHCTQQNRRARPTMLDVFNRLKVLEFPGKGLIEQ